MFSRVFGEGDRTYFGIHGWSGTHETFLPLLTDLPEDIRFISVDLPGHGRSRWVGSPDLPAIADEVAREMEKVESFTLVGNCSGALIGLAALEARPHLQSRVERMVLIDPFAFTPWYFGIFVFPVLGRLFYHSTFANPLGRWLTNLSLRGKRSEETDLTHSFQRVDHQVSYRYLELLTSIGSIERWSGMLIDTDIVHGERTFGAIRESIGMWRGIWPHIRIHELPAAGHLPILEATEDVRQILFDEI
ncbi:MAG: alpha/beta fold hydrolase [Acidobacteriota bacterium]